MASYTSTQNGNFDSTATWGGGGSPSVNGDSFTVAAGHTVTYNISGTITDGFNNSTVNGNFIHGTGVTELKMDGNLDIKGGLYEMVDDSTLVFKGDNSDDHGLNIYTDNNTSFLATGSSPTQESKLFNSGDAGDDYFTVYDATNFQTGDWCSIHYRYDQLKSREDWTGNVNYPTGPLSGNGVSQSQNSWDSNDQNHNEPAHCLDEGFIIHDIYTSNIYPRNLVGPEETITAVSPNSITVTDSRVFRIGQKLIFGHSNNRNVLEISEIRNPINKIVFTTDLSSTNVVGEKVYLGGALMHHYGNSTVRRVASQLAATSAKDATTVTINEASDFVVGDVFYVDHIKTDAETWTNLFGGQGNNSWRYDINERHVVTNKSGNTLTFTPALPHAAAAESFLYKGNRKITIRGADFSVDKPYLYLRSNTSTATIDGQTRYRRKVNLKNVQLLGLGNSSSNFSTFFRGGFNDGYWRYSHSFEGLVMDGCGNTESNYVRHDSQYYAIHRNEIIANYLRGGYSGNSANCAFNSVYLNCRRSNENRYFYYRNGKYWFNRMNRIYDYDYIRSPTLAGGIVNYYQNYYNGLNGIQAYGTINIFQSHITCRYYPVRAYKETQKRMAYTKISQIDEGTSDSYYFDGGRPFHRYNPEFNLYSKDEDYILDNDVIYSGSVKKVWLPEEGAYRVIGPIASVNASSPQGSYQQIEVPPKTTVTITAEAKLPNPTYNNGTNYTYRPILLYYLTNSLQHETATWGPFYSSEFRSSDRKFNRLNINPDSDVNFGNAGLYNYDDTSFNNSYDSNSPFTSQTEYKSKTITLTNDAWFTKSLRVGLCGVNDNARYGWYEKPLRISMTQIGGSGNKSLNSILSVGERILRLGVNTVNNIKRIGGSKF
jgi:hypothetical protein